MKNPLLSIVISCYNDAEYIEQAVSSALNQTYSNKEVIIVDDGSNIETKAVLKKLEPTITKLIAQENQGQSIGRNKGIREAKGEYILNLDSDDFFESVFCEKAIAFFKKDSTFKIITCYTTRLLNNKKMDVFMPDGGEINNFLLTNCAMGSAMFKKSDWQATNGYDENMRQGFEDWEFYIRLVKEGGSAYVIPELLFNYRLKENSTSTKANKIKYELLHYIYIKHRELYMTHFDLFISHLLSKTKQEELEKIKNTERIEFRIGKAILRPLRWIKAVLK
ncbi:glycosyltransferase family 2 protein [Flavobacterium sp. LB1P71]|uniref:glycosyltransferase family 2 protein n=1 Tax=unclassified Flavobacterium TaxID=196869 RepID=UPI003AB08D0C